MTAAADNLKASFTTDNSYKAYYTQGFDSEEEFATWTVEAGNPRYTWTLAEGMSGGVSFATIDPESKMSMSIEYYNGARDETVTSPEITILPNSIVEFYNHFNPVWLYEAGWTFYATDVATGDTVQFLNQFLWANNSAYDETKWLRFRFPLDRLTGKTVRFSFKYAGNGGDTQLIDGFRVIHPEETGTAAIDILQGDSIRFNDTSAGNVSSWRWEFEGGTPAVSEERDPVVRYLKTGTYSVRLTVSDGTATDAVSREGYVSVRAEQPNALIGMPEEGYLSPFVATLIPTGVPVTFRDLSTGFPTEWKWTFKGAEPETRTEQNPVVTYNEKGLYSLSLQATNSAGTDQDAMLYAVQAGGAQYVWNLEIGESDYLGKVSLSWFGNYAGSNWLGMEAFAEHFAKPLAPATIDSVDVYFISAATVSPDADITLSVRKADADGAPGETLASASVKAADIQYSDDDFLPTRFKFGQPAEVSGEFFVVIEGIPNATQEEAPYASDDIAIACVRRGDGQKSTTWQLVEDQDAQGNPLGTSQWFKNTDSPVSMAVCPVITYDRQGGTDGISNIGPDRTADDNAIYTLQGVRVDKPQKGSIYIRGGKKFVAE